MNYNLSSVNIYVYICVGMPLTTVNNNIHGDHILKSIGRTLNSATHSDQLLENNGKTKDSCYIIVILQLHILQQFSS